MNVDGTVEPGQYAPLRPARALLRGVATMLDFTGALARRPRTLSADEDIALAWHEVLGEGRPPASIGPDEFGIVSGASSPETSSPAEEPAGHLLSTAEDEPWLPPAGQGELFTGYHSREDVGYRGPTACAAAGITYRQLDYWARTGLVEPSVRAAGGSSSQRLYSFRDILALKIVKRLLDTGIPLQEIRMAIGILREQGADHLAQVTLMSDGESVYAATSPDEVVDLLQGGQGVFGIALGRVWQEVEGTLADLPQERAVLPEDPDVQPDRSQDGDELEKRRKGRRAG